jgi:transcriptional regulator with XRE-family HTH domain
MNIGEKIRFMRVKNGLSQEALAKSLKTTKQAIYKYENGIVTNIPLEKIEILSTILNTTPAYLMGWEEAESPSPEEPELSEGELELIELFRTIPEDQQSLVLSMIRAAVGNK